jgi:hypothetical protein
MIPGFPGLPHVGLAGPGKAHQSDEISTTAMLDNPHICAPGLPKRVAQDE